MPEKKHLLGMTMDELYNVAQECAMPKFTAKQIADWLYKKRVISVEDMTNISLSNRTALSEKYDIGRNVPTDIKVSADGTAKYLFKTSTGKFVETVMIPDHERRTLCVSSQIGCKLNCLFCMTGKQGFNGNLSATEIMNQIFSVDESENLSNVVFMGMGEPLDNYEELSKVLEIITSDYGMGWSPKRVTVSTTGITPKLKHFLDENTAHLAISIHSPFPQQRLSIMPVEKAYPIAEIIELLREYDWTRQRRLSFEYIIFDEFNDSLVYAKELARLLKGLECRVNLLRFHKIPNVELQPSSSEKMEQFRDYLNGKGITATIRSSRGEDIMAACGMLSTEKSKV